MNNIEKAAIMKKLADKLYDNMQDELGKLDTGQALTVNTMICAHIIFTLKSAARVDGNLTGFVNANLAVLKLAFEE